ncbi:NAD(P)H-dependent flavin oxidoreductase [Prosthecomicrobium sp. N25]|uniref:NAD(P)H-dependent flavin oxidoreductase n=1 Tax=Prosthecomicrobium sp. N25 TaxID=3129254 RepID=UPI0030786E45
MALPAALSGRLKLPAIAAPMFLTSGPDLVVEVCRSGLIGTFPALNRRTTAAFSGWLDEIEGRLAAFPGAAPYGVNLIVHRSNPRLRDDLDVVVRRKVPLVITSLGAVSDVVEAVHSYGGLVFHDVISRRHAEKAAAAGVDGIIAVAAGAGGHAGTLSPFALVDEIRSVFSGTIVLSGAMSTGAHIAGARAMGADLAYLGTRFLATREAMASEAYKAMVVGAAAADILYTPNISGVHANFLKPSLVAAGLDPDHLPPHRELDMQNEARAWKTVWSAGHGVGSIQDVPAAADLCARLIREYREALEGLCGDTDRGASGP